MEFPSAQRLKSGNNRSLIFGVLMFGPAVWSRKSAMSAFYICIGMLLISLSCWCKGKYSGKYSLGFSEESYQGEYNFLSCCGSLSIMNTMKTIQDTKRLFQQSIAELFSVDNLPNVVHHFFQSVLLASKGEWCYKANKLNYNYCNLPEEGYETASRTVVHSQCLY